MNNPVEVLATPGRHFAISLANRTCCFSRWISVLLYYQSGFIIIIRSDSNTALIVIQREAKEHLQSPPGDAGHPGQLLHRLLARQHGAHPLFPRGRPLPRGRQHLVISHAEHLPLLHHQRRYRPRRGALQGHQVCNCKCTGQMGRGVPPGLLKQDCLTLAPTSAHSLGT